MTLSYIWVTVLAVVLLESCNAIFLTILASAPLSRIQGAFPPLPPVLGLQTPVPAAIAGGNGTGLSTQVQPAIIYTWVGLAFFIGMVILVAPLLGGLFGSLTMRGLVRRLRTLTLVATQVAAGDYTMRVQQSSGDELGDLERQFNSMAGQLEESTAQLQRLAEENARLAERKRISRELHDAISQDLFSMRMLADGLQQALEGSELQPSLAPRLTTLEQTASNVIREMRALLLEMRPSSLQQSDLQGALEELALRYEERLGVKISTDVSVATGSLDPGVAHALLRVAQESVSNAVRHAKASAVTISLRLVVPSAVETVTGMLAVSPSKTPAREPSEDTNVIELVVADNGKGLSFDGEAESSGLGLQLMRERIEELGGRISFQGSADGGTTIRAMVPVTLGSPVARQQAQQAPPPQVARSPGGKLDERGT
jgi:NarL family two-component system sensor histidine kinase LiaS